MTASPQPGPRRASIVNGISVDVEDYFHTEAMSQVAPRDTWSDRPCRVEQNTRRLFELFGAHGVRGTFFFLGWVAERFPGLVREAVDLGHEIGVHSYWHRLIYRLKPAEFREDTRMAKDAVENAAGSRAIGYRAPSFSLVPGTEWAQEILAEQGFVYDSSVAPIKHDLYSNADAPRGPHKIASGKLLELPVATVSLGGRNLPVGGGGYLRILPYGYTRWGLSRLNNSEKVRAIVYTHPWEIDAEQPHLPASAKSRFRQYTNLSTAAEKIERLLNEFRFVPIAESFAEELGLSPQRPARVAPLESLKDARA